MGRVRTLPTPVNDVRSADAVRIYPATITVSNTRATYTAALEKLVADFGVDTNVALPDQEPNRVSGWFTFVWGSKGPKTFNIRLTALAAACGYWREQQWPAGDRLVRLRARPAPTDTSKAVSRARVAEILGSDAALRERVLWHMLYESSVRAEEVLMLDVPDLDTANRCAVVTRKGGSREVIAWQADRHGAVVAVNAGRPRIRSVVSHRPQSAAFGGPQRYRPIDRAGAPVVSACGGVVRDLHRTFRRRPVHAAPVAAFAADPRRRGRGLDAGDRHMRSATRPDARVGGGGKR